VDRDDPGAVPSGDARDSRSAPGRPTGLWSYDGGWKSTDADAPSPDRAPRGSERSRRGSGERPAGRLGRRAGVDGPASGHLEDALGDPESVARAICLRLLTVQPRTRAELATALAKRGVPDGAAETVLGRFTEVGLIDDRAFAAAWVDSRHAGRGLARRALAAELRRRGVDGDVVGEAVSVVDAAAEELTARRLVDRRLPSTRRLEQPARVRRLAGMLARKGYPPGLSMRVVRDALAAEGADPGELDGLDDSVPED
jgi:regulatory protein